MRKIDFSKVWTIIPIGGLGIRLSPYTATTSKALVPLINMFPITEFILYGMAKELGIKNFVFGIKGFQNYIDVQGYYQGGKGWSAKWGIIPRAHFQYQNPNFEDTGSADCVAYNVRKFQIKTPIIVHPCDNLVEPKDLGKLYEFALETNKPLIVGLTQVKDTSPYGLVEFEKDGVIIKRFIEKPSEKQRKISNLINTFSYIIKPEAFKYLIGDFGRDTLPKLAKKGLLAGFEFSKSWYDLGSPKLHLRTFQTLLKKPHGYFQEIIKRVSSNIKGADIWIRGKSPYSRHINSQIKKQVNSKQIKAQGIVLIGRDCFFGENITLQDSSIGDLSVVENNSSIKDCNIMDACAIGKNVSITNSLIGRGVIINDYSSISDSFIANNARIGSGVQLKNQTIAENEQVVR